MYSFIKPRGKYSLDTVSYMWLGFIVVISVMMMFFGLFLDTKNKNFGNELVDLKTKISNIDNDKKKIKKDIENIMDIQKSYKLSLARNNSIKSGLKNLLSLIPDQIKIKKLYMTQTELKIYGLLDSPKTYNLFLKPALKSIFDKSKVGFTKRENDYLFSSYNQLKEVKHEK